MEDISKALVYEIKQDIANRYFGFRKQIETESGQYLEKLQNVDGKYFDQIITDLRRIHCLLPDDRLYRTFLEFTGIPPSVSEAATCPESPGQRQQLFSGLRGKGLTRRRRYRNLLFQAYRLLAGDIASYREIFLELEEEHEDIRKEIERFYRMHDLSGILSFLRELDNPDSMNAGLLAADRPTLAGQNMEEGLRILPPPAVTTRMTLVPSMPVLEDARTRLDVIIPEAFGLFSSGPHHDLPF